MVRFFVSAVFDFFFYSLFFISQKNQLAGTTVFFFNCCKELGRQKEDKKRRIRRAEFTMITSMLASRALFGEPMVIQLKISNASSSTKKGRIPKATTNAAVGDTNDENSVSSSSYSSSSSSSKSSKSGKKANHSDDIVYSSGSNNNNNDPVSIYNEEMKDVEKLSLEELSRNFVEVEYTGPKASTSSPSSKGKMNTVLRNVLSSIFSPQWIALALTYVVLKRFRDERDVKLVKEMLSMEEKDLNELPVNERRVEIERARLKWRLKQLRKDRTKVKNFKRVEIMITERLKMLTRMKMKQAEAEVKRAEWLERVGDAQGAESAIKEAERIVDLKTGTIDIAGKKMKTPHPGANLKWMKPEDYVEQLQKSFLAKTEEDKADDASGKDDVIIPTLLPEIDERNGKGYDGSGRDGKTVFSNITDSIDSAAVDNISEEEIKKVEAKVKEFSSSASSAASKNSEEEQMPADLEEALKNMDRDFMTMKYTEDELFEKYEAVLDKYGLNVPKNETGASEEDFYKQMDFGEESKDESNLHPQLRDPYYYKSLRAVHAIFVNRPNQEYEEFLCMQMVPGEIPEKERPKDTFHVVAFESIEDAERFCHLTRSQREANEDPVYTTRPFSVNGLEDEAGKINRGVTVVGASRVDLKPGRSATLVLNEIMSIGNEVYFWEFAKQCKRTFDEKEEQMKKPAPPTIDGAF